MKVERQDVERIVGFSKTDFAVWLRYGFRDKLQNTDQMVQANAFSPLQYFMGRGESLTDDVKKIYGALPKDVQERFREGLAIAMDFSDDGEKLMCNWGDVARRMLYLAGRIEAVEIFPEMILWINDDSIARHFFLLIVNIATGMSPADGVANFLRIVAANKWFDVKSAPMVLIGLCRAEPEKFADHMDLLREAFAQLHQEKSQLDNTWMTAVRISQYVHPEILSQYIFQEGDEWLKSALVNS